MRVRLVETVLPPGRVEHEHAASRRRFHIDNVHANAGKISKGSSFYNKTLGVIGMGRIGSELSRRAIAFGMRVIAMIPISRPRARQLAGGACRRAG